MNRCMYLARVGDYAKDAVRIERTVAAGTPKGRSTHTNRWATTAGPYGTLIADGPCGTVPSTGFSVTANALLVLPPYLRFGALGRNKPQGIA